MPYCFSRSFIKFQGHTGQKKLPILTRIERFRTVTQAWLHRWIWGYFHIDIDSLDCGEYSWGVRQHRGDLVFIRAANLWKLASVTICCYFSNISQNFSSFIREMWKNSWKFSEKFPYPGSHFLNKILKFSNVRQPCFIRVPTWSGKPGKNKIFWKSHGKSWNFEKSSKIMELIKSHTDKSSPSIRNLVLISFASHLVSCIHSNTFDYELLGEFEANPLVYRHWFLI